MQFQAYEKECPRCPLKGQCLKTSQQKPPRQINIKIGITKEKAEGLIEKMKQKIDSPQGRLSDSVPVRGFLVQTKPTVASSYADLFTKDRLDQTEKEQIIVLRDAISNKVPPQ